MPCHNKFVLPCIQIFVIATIFGDLWMVLVAGSIVFGYCYMVVYIRGKHVWQHMSSQNSSKSLSVASDDLDVSVCI